MRKQTIIVLSMLGLLVVLTMDASAQKLNRNKLKQNAETLRRQIDSLRDVLKDLEDAELPFIDTTGFGDLFGTFRGQGSDPGSFMLPYLNIDPQEGFEIPDFPNGLQYFQDTPPLRNQPAPLPKQDEGTPIPGFPNWRFQLLGDICRQL